MGFKGRRRPRRKAAWEWADSTTVTVPDTTEGGAPAFSTTWLLPPGRVKWLCDTSKRDHLVHQSTLLWLNFAVINSGSAAQHRNDCMMYVIKDVEDENGTGPQNADFAPYSRPKTPSQVTDWTSGDEASDGLDPYLWTHIIPGLSGQTTFGYLNQQSNGAGGGASAFLGGNDISGYPEHATQAFQPSVVIHARRRLMRNEGLALAVLLPVTQNNGLTYNLQAWWRTLLS